MKILILTGKFGLGHWSASLSLRQQLLQCFPRAQVEVEDLIAYALPETSDLVYKGFHWLVTRGSGLFNLYYKLTQDVRIELRPACEGLLLSRLNRLLEERCPDAVIATHPACAQLISRYKRLHRSALPLVTCVTDLTAHAEWINYGTDCYLVGTEDIRDQLRVKGVPGARILVTGIPVKEEFKHIRRRPADRERRLLIMGGGLGLMPRTDRFYEALNSLPGVRVTLITGRNQKLYDRLAGRYDNIEVVGFTDRVYDYMAQSDLLLSKPGGITLFESIFAELPMLAWEPFLEQEKKNARALEERGLGRVAAKEPEACLSAIRALIYDDDALECMASRMRALKSQLEEEDLVRRLSQLVGAKEACA
ncbi:MGDG synthase family glycosyltransferase [Lawsonibacter celer]|jgi:processive 1,2-diacylglycerol beta-glucosyltransferase|uniref:MGDG synthase family glycosyltransferase n=1 Tax=Lawsonibacter celer TaxID=2986526 RepID=UPI0016452896|nr:glycosyltransferase [Lawsonibacter celer]